jgi:hypothetical protein
MQRHQRKLKLTRRVHLKPKWAHNPTNTVAVRLLTNRSSNFKVVSTGAKAATSKATSSTHHLRIQIMPITRTGSTAKAVPRHTLRIISGDPTIIIKMTENADRVGLRVTFCYRMLYILTGFHWAKLKKQKFLLTYLHLRGRKKFVRRFSQSRIKSLDLDVDTITVYICDLFLQRLLNIMCTFISSFD